jgi:hypothetical protein
MAESHRTIVTRGMAKGHHDEGILGTVAIPGMHVTLQADGEYDKSPETAAELVKTQVLIVKEDQLQGKTINDAYAVGDLAFLYTPIPGDHINALIKTGANIAVGDKITPEGGGSGLFIEAAGTEAQYRAKARESSSGVLAADTHLIVEWLN